MIDFWTIAATLLLGILGFVLLVYLLCWALPHIMPVIKDNFDGMTSLDWERFIFIMIFVLGYGGLAIFMWADIIRL